MEQEPEFSRVCYDALIVDVRRKDLSDGLELLRTMDAGEREALLCSVKKALNSAVETLKRDGKLDKKTMQDAANDLGIWFANEVFENRAEQYKVAVN